MQSPWYKNALKEIEFHLQDPQFVWMCNRVKPLKSKARQEALLDIVATFRISEAGCQVLVAYIYDGELPKYDRDIFSPIEVRTDEKKGRVILEISPDTKLRDARLFLSHRWQKDVESQLKKLRENETDFGLKAAKAQKLRYMKSKKAPLVDKLEVAGSPSSIHRLMKMNLRPMPPRMFYQLISKKRHKK